MPGRKIGTKVKRPDELAEICGVYKRHRKNGMGVQQSYERTAEDLGYTADSVAQVVRRFIPTTDVASSYLKANTLRMAMRLVRKANPAEIIDVLSRKDIGVLAPKSEEAGGQQGFFLSVQADSCGAVKVGVTSGQMTLLAPQKPELPAGEVIDVEPEDEFVPRVQGHVPALGHVSERQAAAIQAANNRLHQARSQAAIERHSVRLTPETSEKSSSEEDSLEV